MRVSGFTSLPSFYSMTGSWTAQARRAVLVACGSAVLARYLGSLLHSGYAGSWTAQASRAVLVACGSAVLDRP